MLSAISAFALTLLVGPIMFLLLQQIGPLDKKLDWFPTGLASSVGDTLFLPFFNSIAVYQGILGKLQMRTNTFWYVILVSFIMSIIYVKYKRDWSNFNHWLRPEKGKLSIVGWYHSFYFSFQFFFIVFSILNLSNNPWLWFALLGYIYTLVHSKMRYGL